MTYSSFGTDDSDLDEWLRQQAESSSLDDLASPDAPMGGGMPAFHAPPHAQMAPLNYNTGPDWTDALGAGTSALAALADLGLNHGRGTGQILSSAGAFGQARAEQRLKGTQDALGYEQKRAELERQNNYNDYLYANMAQRTQHQGVTDANAAQRIDVSKQNAGTKATAESRQGAKVERDTSADSDYAQQFRDWAAERGLSKPGELDNMSYEQMKSANPALLKAWEFDHTGDKAQAARAGTLAADLDAEPDTTAAAARKASAVQTATQGGKLELVDETARAKAKADQDIAGDKQIGNADVADPNVWKNVSTKGYNDANDIAMSRATFKKSMDDMAAIRARAGTQVMPSGDKTAYDSAQSAASSSLSTLFKTGVISEPEYRRYVERIPNSGMSAGSVWGAATGQDVVGDQISGTRDELLGIFDTGLGQYGLKAKKAAQPPTSGADNYGPDADHPSNLGRMSGVIPKVPVNAGPAMGDGVMMQSPSGNSGRVPPDKVAAAMAAGWKRL